uniref:TonB-dependent receptor n=1 Tax=Pseudomonas viridiflava TaxID=33069 RepID=UPI000F045307
LGSLAFVRDKADGHSGSYTVYDAAVHYDLGRLNNTFKGISVAVNANNVFDRVYYAAIGTSSVWGSTDTYGDPRNFTLTAKYTF